ncbi:MAG: SDR family NAD(P)-dependent oxidoreductase [Ferruginibacter sp.]
MILVTGGAGLLGRELVQQLAEDGENIRVIYNNTKPDFSSFKNVELLACDILDVIALEEAMKGIITLYHCAGLVSFHKKDFHRLYKINVEGTANVVNAALDAGVKKMIHVSSVAALGRIRNGEEVNEDMQWTAKTSNSIYGHSKYLGELEAWRGIAEGLPAVIVNPVIILGPADWEDGSTAIFRSAYNEFPWYTEGVSGFADVRDVAKAMIALMASAITDKRYIVSGGNHSYREVFTKAALAFQKRPPYKKVTPMMAKLVTIASKIKSIFIGKPPFLTPETAATAQAVVHFDNTRLLSALPGFQYHSLEDTINYTCNILQQKLNKQ